jgi:large subunit ribosomal protein L6
MSRIGKLPVSIPKGTTVAIEDTMVTVQGPKGKLQQKLFPEVNLSIEDDQAVVTRINETKRSRAFHGLFRKLLSNMVIGVNEGFSKTLLISGVGYRTEMQGNVLVLNLGYSNPIEFQVPEDITIQVEGNNKITVSGIDRQRVGQVSAEIRSIRPPEPYKGKGVKYENEMIRRKIGKSAVK